MTRLSKLLDLLCPLRVRYRELKANYEAMSTRFALANNALTPEQRTEIFGPQLCGNMFDGLDLSALPCVTHVDLRTVESTTPPSAQG